MTIHRGSIPNFSNEFGKCSPRYFSSLSVEWPRYTKRERGDRCWLGGQLIFFWGDIFCCIKPQMGERDGGKAAEWAYKGMTQGALKLLAYPHISPLDGKIHVFPTPRTFLWCLTKVNWRIVLSYKSILLCHEISDKYRVLDILSNILYHIEYCSDRKRRSAGCSTS